MINFVKIGRLCCFVNLVRVELFEIGGKSLVFFLKLESGVSVSVIGRHIEAVFES